MFCNNCGNKLRENDKFCSKCGTEVSKNFLLTDSNDTMNIGEDEVSRSVKNGSNFKIYLIIILILFLLIGFRTLNFFGKASSIKEKSTTKVSEKSGVKVEKLEKISLEYNTQDWESTHSNSYDSRKIKSDSGKIGMFFKSKYYLDYLSLEQYLNDFKDTCSSSCELIEDIQSVNINGDTWYRFATSRNGYSNLYLYFTNGVYTYIIIYTAKSSDYSNEMSKVEEVLSTIKYSESV